MVFIGKRMVPSLVGILKSTGKTLLGTIKQAKHHDDPFSFKMATDLMDVARPTVGGRPRGCRARATTVNFGKRVLPSLKSILKSAGKAMLGIIKRYKMLR